MMEKISKLENEIRELINHPRKKHFLMLDATQWYQLCSSMDVIGDTELAINSYLQNINKPAQYGELYILLYGILQVLFVQQDAVKHLAESLGVEYKPSKALNEIRDIRNDSVGHPTKREFGKGRDRDKSYNFITRMSMTRNGFTLITRYPDRNFTVKKVDLPQLIREQRETLANVLTEVLGNLKREAMDHKNQFKDEKLADIFPPTLYYFFEKVTEAVFGDAPVKLELGALNVIVDVIQKFKLALESRQIYDSYAVADDFEWVDYCLQKVRQYFDGSGEYKLNEKDAIVYLSFLNKKAKDLQEMAVEIDEYYETEG